MATPPERPTYWSRDIAALLREIDTTADGLTNEEASRRRALFGDNRLRAAQHGPLAKAILGQLRSPLLWLLCFATAASAAFGETTDALVVATILVLGSLISILQDARAGRSLARLAERVALRSRVVRGGTELEIPAVELVRGDVILLSAGSLVPADAVLIDARDLFASEAALTGEAFPVEKRVGTVAADAVVVARTNCVHMGTSIRSGTARAVVVETGMRTAFGALAGRLVLRPPETEFQRGLRHFGYALLTAMLVLALVVFGASALQSHAPIDALLFAIALAVGLAPEMLPAVLATMLSRGARRLAARGVLVRRLEAIESLGNMDVLCTDKTGTLTEGEVKLEGALDVVGVPSLRVESLAYWNAALQSGLPNPLDRAIVEAREDHGPLPRKLDELPFDFSRRRLSVALAPEGDAPPLLVTKGAFEAVLAICTRVRKGDDIVALDDVTAAELHERAESWSRTGVRVLAIATREWARATTLDHDAERELVFEGFLTFRDPPKQGVEAALAALRALSVRVIVVSGDHHAVVRHLAEEVGLRTDEVVTGAQLAAMGNDALWHVVERCDLFAEVDPGQKERILLALKATGHVVGFMGDGINDAPAMHDADVGISVEGATDVAREAADFVLLQRDLDTVAEGIREGRRTWANTQKYLLTTESANLGNMISMAAASLFLPFLPMLAKQVLLNNLLSDVPSATLSTDSVDDELVERPERWDIGFMTRFMVGFGLLSAAFDGLTFVMLALVLDASAEEFRTAWFSTSLLTELFVLLVLRTRRRAWRSRPHSALLGTSLVVAAIAIALPLSPFRDLLGFVQLPAATWTSVLGITLGYVVTVELCKVPLLRLVARPRPRALRV